MSEHSAVLFSTYVDLATALDAIGREDLWKITAKYGCPRKFYYVTSIVQQLHDDIQARVQDNGEMSESSHVSKPTE